MVKHLEDRVARLAQLVKGWTKSNTISHIERDLALDELRRLYDALLSVECSKSDVAAPKAKPEPKTAPKSVQQKETAVQHKVDPIADFDDALDIDALLGLTDDEPQEASATEAAPVPQTTPEPQTDSTAQTAPGRVGGLFAIEDIPVRNKSSRKMITLYNTPTTKPAVDKQATAAVVANQASTPATAPAAASSATPAVTHTTAVSSEPVAEVADAMSTPRLGDVLAEGKRVVGDVPAIDNDPIAPMNKISDLRKAIGLNDKFLLLRDLFAGDVPLYERTIDKLNSFEDLDDCMIYIVENFRWNPDSEGAKMLVSLIERKLT